MWHLRISKLFFAVVMTAVLACLSFVPGLPLSSAEATHKKPAVDSPVARLQERIDRGEVQLQFDGQFGYLRSVMKELQLSPSSQSLIFSKTSLQVERVGPQTPHAVYFTDDVAVGYVAGSNVLEFAALNPKDGVMDFYTLRQTNTGPVHFEKKFGCNQCHWTPVTLKVPGMLSRSVFPDHSGELVPQARVFNTTHETPLQQRWGGWYVTGNTGKQLHMGNAMVREGGQPEDLQTEDMQNLPDLSERIDTGRLLTPYSDVVAIMTLEHQAHMVNLILRATYVWDEGPRTIDTAVENLVKYMLFTQEARLTAPVRGTSGFAQEFAGRGPRDKKGRSLRDFDMRARMFRYPCSYMIYSDGFDGIPANVRDRIYRRLWQVLTGQDTSPQFARLSSADRKAILEILRDTKKRLPAYWLEQTR